MRGQCKGGCGFVNLDAELFDLRGELKAHYFHHLLVADVFVMFARLGLGRWSEDGRRQFAGVFEPCGQCHTAY